MDALFKMLKDNGNIHGYSFGASMIARTIEMTPNVAEIARIDKESSTVPSGAAQTPHLDHEGGSEPETQENGQEGVGLSEEEGEFNSGSHHQDLSRNVLLRSRFAPRNLTSKLTLTKTSPNPVLNSLLLGVDKNSSTRVRVHVDGLKPLIKESIIEFDSGEESLITLEYEKLETHCSKCASLLHARRNCPVKAESEPSIQQLSRLSPIGESLRPEIPRAPKEGTNSLEENSARATSDQQEFKVRRDRHGNPFGERISTKQTRVPPPVNAVVTREINTQNWRSSKTQDEPQRYSSPQYTQNRQKPNRVPQRGRDLFPQREQAQWRPRLVPAPEDPTNHSRRQQVPTTPTNLNSGNSQLSNGVSRVQTMEEVMEDLHHVTRQYLNCADPVEAAARKQRVMQSDANGDMEETAAAIIASETRRHELSSQQRGMDSNPNTPPPRRDYTIQELLGPDPSVGYSPLIREEEAKEVEPSYIEVEGSPKQRSEGPAKLKSIIIRSPNSVAEAPTPEQATQVATEEEETLLEFQNIVKRRSRRNKRGRSPRNSPIILRGAICLPPTGVSNNILPWICWAIWTARNLAIFENRTLSAMEVATKGIRLAREWNMAQDKKKATKNTPPRLHRPPRASVSPAVLTIGKSDAAFDNRSHRAGFAWNFTDSAGTMIIQGSKIQDSIGSPLIAEALALRSAILSAVNSEVTHLKMFSDNSTLVRAITNDTQASEIFGIVNDIQQMTSAFVEISFSHFPRLQNIDADLLAKQTLRCSL
ncbi:hypothetical protein IGI04_043051 [Brassica rapa subsp. trilocularis]|uniref:RNase H type-1 domain-containing protein n=1 Tax=Brassica rapa subsp. trilocularis TaxID=1813537 RepID=A0ABQ7KJE7_BRACM|nr:hypothetical protein IGI04_043051 [Brassica rapa subsp. trilocularis]